MPSQDEDLSCHASHIREVYSTEESLVENGLGHGLSVRTSPQWQLR